MLLSSPVVGRLPDVARGPWVAFRAPTNGEHGISKSRPIGLNIADLRHQRFLTQMELAERSGLSQKAISEIETGKKVPRGSTVRRIAAVLGVKPESLNGVAL